ncbi:hypothetical protein B0T13DRAFT_445988 [Neurospora crassa]|nr:hypothetical protein B0T13DRAFT_445988 [Neurospora crassa]
MEMVPLFRGIFQCVYSGIRDYGASVRFVVWNLDRRRQGIKEGRSIPTTLTYPARYRSVGSYTKMNGYLHRFTDHLYVLEDYRPSLSPPAPAAGGNRSEESKIYYLKAHSVLVGADGCKWEISALRQQVDSLISLSASRINGVGVVTSCFRYAAPVTGGGWGDYLRWYKVIIQVGIG